MGTSGTHNLDTVFSALADPTRRSIVQRLSQREATVNELAAQYPISLPAVSRHLRVLEDAGLLQRRVEGRVHHCSLKVKPLEEAAAWITRYRDFWEKRFDDLERYLEQSESEDGNE